MEIQETEVTEKLCEREKREKRGKQRDRRGAGEIRTDREGKETYKDNDNNSKR